MKKKAVVVYQGSIANVFEVNSFNMSDYGREAKRILQSDFYTCETFAQGLGHAGYLVGSASCNMTGNITQQKWAQGIEDCPFQDTTHPVWIGVEKDT